MTIGTHIAIRLMLTGRVQGLGVRPAIAQWAGSLSLSGWVTNTCQGVEVRVEGPAESIERFSRELLRMLPAAAVVERQQCLPVSSSHAASLQNPSSQSSSPQNASFEIRSAAAAAGPLTARVPPDVVTCDECRNEALGDRQSRSGYGLNSCAACGPRFSILTSMPFERDRTTMCGFTMCPACQREYDSPQDRRFHAQTNACPACGPQWWCRDKSLRRIPGGEEAIRIAAQSIGRGEIIALQGLGGYQLIVDATSEEAVSRLRHRKQRFGKPFAVMVGNLEEAQRVANCSDVECDVLGSPAGPIVVLGRRESTNVAADVSPGLDTLGVMLPTTLLHVFLLNACRRPLVVTSGNREGEPLEFEHPGADSRLAEIADLWLEHDRVIQRPVDDSVVRVIAGRVAVLRLGRGFAPLSLNVPLPGAFLAVGGHQKAAIAISNGAQAVLGPHVGDLDTVAERERWERQLADLVKLYGLSPSTIICDRHPDYASTRWALQQPQPSIAVQHHHAHVVAGMIEHNWLDRTVLGVAFDGTGFGDDQTIWGGEFLTATSTEFQRVGHLLAFNLPGGERAVREPWRVAVSLVQRAAGSEVAAALKFATGRARDLLPFIVDNPHVSPFTSSAGRLFDGIAALVIGVERSQFEGEGPMQLEAVCDRSDSRCYNIPLNDTQPFLLDWRPAVRQILGDMASAVPPGVIAMRFHRGLATAIFQAIRRFPRLPVVLSGGCFQNRLLVELVLEQCGKTDQPIGPPGLIPVNDGGLAAGQLAIAASRFQHEAEGE